MPKITHLKGCEVLDSRGVPALEIELSADNGVVSRAIVPNGDLKSHQNVVELRDSDNQRFLGQGIMRAVGHIANELSEVIVGMDILDQKAIDDALLNADGTKNQNRFGINTLYGVSVAACKAAALSLNIETCEYVAGNKPMAIPVPAVSMISGGVYNEKSLAHGFDFKDLLIVPVGAESYRESLMWSSEIYQSLGALLKKYRIYSGTSPTGGYLVNLDSKEGGGVDNSYAFDLLVAAVELAGLKLEDNIKFICDCDGDFFYDKNVDRYKLNNPVDSKYDLKVKVLMNYYNKLRKNYPIVAFSNLFHNEDFENLNFFFTKMPEIFEVIADDIFASNNELIQEYMKNEKLTGIQSLTNAVALKPSLVGTVSGVVELIEYLQSCNVAVYLSCRSGETNDDFLADLTVGSNCFKMINGATAHGENLVKYNRLLRLEDNLRGEAVFVGVKSFGDNEG